MADEDDRETPAESDEEDDWFERALRAEEAAAAPDGETPEPSAGESGSVDGTETGTESGFGTESGAESGAGPEGEAPAVEAFDAGGGGADEFGFGNMPAAGEAAGGAEFEEEEFESAIPRIDVGVEGLDEMIQGGVPERSLLVVLGGAGTGKTTFGLQFLEEALRNDEQAVFITLEETRDRIVTSATEKGWPFDEYLADDRLAIVDLDPVEMANSLTSIRNELPRLVQEFGASRLVLDSVSLLEMMYDDQATRRTEVFDFTQSLKRAGVTTLLTSEASESSPFASRHGIIEYLTDGVVVLRYVRPEDFRETRLAVEITKIRDANHSRETKPYEITSQGINVYRQANIF